MIKISIPIAVGIFDLFDISYISRDAAGVAVSWLVTVAAVGSGWGDGELVAGWAWGIKLSSK